MALDIFWDVLNDTSSLGIHTLVNSSPTRNTNDLCNHHDFEEMEVCGF